MIWTNKQQLQYYNMRCDAPCYCELLVYPSDLILQGSFGKGTAAYSVGVAVWSVDGNTALENVDSSYYDVFTGYNKFTGRDFFTLKFKAWTPVMCSNGCFLIRVGVTDLGTGQLVFAEFTERYCMADCCDFARDIYVTQDGNDIGTGGSTPSITPGTAFHCGQPIIRLYTWYDCFDAFTGELYEVPFEVYSGEGFKFYKVTNFRGKFQPRPREIARDISYNCRLLKTETEKVYILDGFEYFPAWKMADMENQLMSTTVLMDDFKFVTEVKFKGGAPFTLFNDCCEIFKLKTALSECPIRQYHSCGDSCNNETYGQYDMIYALPSEGIIYNEQGIYIAGTKEALVIYLRSLEGVTKAEEIAQSPVVVDAYALIGINTDGVAPSSFYVGGRTPNYRVFGTNPETLQEIADTLIHGCAMPVLGTIIVTQVICVSPAVGAIIVTGETSTAVTVVPFGDWTDDGAIAGEASGGVSRINLKLVTSTITKPDADPVTLASVPIGTVTSAGRPITPQILNNSNNGTIPADVTIIIDENGLIRYSGEPTDGDGSGIEIDISDITYNLS